jgi:2-oxoglutarate ferredoxin oxidoreductase subunit delta
VWVANFFRGPEKLSLPARGGWSVTVERDMCKACRFCIEVCPVDVFRWGTEANALGWFPVEVGNQDACVGCMLCYQLCPDFCINVEKIGMEKAS